MQIWCLDLGIVIKKCFLFWVMSRTDRMTSDLNKTGPVERDTEQVSVFVHIFRNLLEFYIIVLVVCSRIARSGYMVLVLE